MAPDPSSASSSSRPFYRVPLQSSTHNNKQPSASRSRSPVQWPSVSSATTNYDVDPAFVPLPSSPSGDVRAQRQSRSGRKNTGGAVDKDIIHFPTFQETYPQQPVDTIESRLDSHSIPRARHQSLYPSVSHPSVSAQHAGNIPSELLPLPNSDYRRISLTDQAQPRALRRSLGSAAVLDAEAIRKKDSEARAGVAISKPGPRFEQGLSGRGGRAGRGGNKNALGTADLGRRRGRHEAEESLEVKIVILGASGSGKTCLARRFSDHSFLPPSPSLAPTTTPSSTSPASSTNSSKTITPSSSPSRYPTSLSAITPQPHAAAQPSAATIRSKDAQGTVLFTCKTRATVPLEGHGEDGATGEVEVKIQLWVVSEKHRSLTKLYYRGANAVILLYDPMSLPSFLEISSWLEELSGLDALLYIAGTKSDLANARHRSPTPGRSLGPAAKEGEEKAGGRAVERAWAREMVTWWLSPPGARGPQPKRDDKVRRQDLPSARMEALKDGGTRRKTSLQRSKSLGNAMDPPGGLAAAAEIGQANESAVSTSPDRPAPYRFLSLLSSSSPTNSESRTPSESGHRSANGSRSNSFSALSLLTQSHSPEPPARPGMSGSKSGFDLRVTDATLSSGRRKSTDWSGWGGALGGLGATEPTPSPSDDYSRRKSEELLRDRDDSRSYPSDGDPWGRPLTVAGQSVRMGEVSAKANRGVEELFQSITGQLVLRRRRIEMERARKERESVYLVDSSEDALGTGKAKKEKGGCC